MSAVAAAKSAWGQDLPDWVLRLAQECEATSQRKVSDRLGYSATVVSQVLNRKYPGATHSVEEVVRGVLMAAVVECPQLGTLPTHECREWRLRARAFAGHNSLRVTMFRACHRCRLFQEQDQ